jgi:hypothetical protein
MTMNAILQQAEGKLASSVPFGEVDYLDTCITELYRDRLGILSKSLPEARPFLDSLLRADRAAAVAVLRDPVVRNSINDALVSFALNEQPTSTALAGRWATILELARSFLGPGLEGRSALETGLEPRMRLPVQSKGPLIWCGCRNNDLAADEFRNLFSSIFPKLRLIEPDSQEIDLLTAGATLLTEMLPTLGRSALHHVYLVAIVGSAEGDAPFNSVTHPSILGTIFFSRSILENEWRVAEYLLHEALHVKFLDIRHTHSLLRHGYTDQASRKIRPHWNRPRPEQQNE